MFEHKAGNKTLNEWATAFCKRKYNSDFSKEMTNSVQKYIDQLKTLGYAEEASASESVSTGVLLRKDETWISIAYSEGGFGIRISVEKS